MQQQPLAFTLVKTIVSARDEGKAVSPALATAWDLLHSELSPAHRVIASEVKWSPAHQEDLRFVIEGIRKQFEKDPDLEKEFLAFLAEVEQFEEEEEKSSILPFVVGGATVSELAKESEVVTDGGIVFEPAAKVSLTTEPPIAADVQDPIVDATGDDSRLESQSEVGELESQGDLVDVSTVETPQELEAIAEKIRLETPVTEPIESLEQEVATDSAEDISPSEPMAPSSASAISFWPLAVAALVLVIIAASIWKLYSPEESTAQKETPLEAVLPKVEDIPIKIIDPISEDSLTNAVLDSLVFEEPTTGEKPSLYSAANVVELSRVIDSLRAIGDYKSALLQQQKLVSKLSLSAASEKEYAQALSELAILYAGQDNLLQAIVEQRKSLDFARQAYAKTDIGLGRSHLKLAVFYTKNGELHMARAHLQQACQIFGMTQELVSPAELEKTDILAKQIQEAS